MPDYNDLPPPSKTQAPQATAGMTGGSRLARPAFFRARMLLTQHTIVLNDVADYTFSYDTPGATFCGLYTKGLVIRTYFRNSTYDGDATFTSVLQSHVRNGDSPEGSNPALPDGNSWTDVTGSSIDGNGGRVSYRSIPQDLIGQHDWLRAIIRISAGTWTNGANPELCTDVWLNSYTYQRQNSWSYFDKKLNLAISDQRRGALDSFRHPDD